MNANRLEETMGTKLENITDQIEEGIRKGKFTWSEIQEGIVTKTKEAAKTTDDYVHENPWKILGIAAACGLVLGLVLTSGRSSD